MEFQILGPLEVRDDGEPVALGGGKQRALLALLLLRPNEVVSSDRLIDELWHGEPPETARKALQVHVSNLRKALGEGRIVTQAPGYRLRVEPGELDLERFETLRGVGDADGLRSALAIWRGAPLADFAYEPFAQAERHRLEELRLTTIEQRIEADLELGRHADLVPELERLVADEPLRERPRAQLMLALYRCGRQADALDSYQTARRVLVDELGIEPGRALQELEGDILRQDPSLDWTPPPQAPDASEAQTASIRSAGVFVGRDRELAQCQEALDCALAGNGRLVLISGEPGIGKSRLAEEVAAAPAARGATVLVGRCWEAGGAPPYWPWTQALRNYVRRSDPRVLRAHLGSGAADLANVVPDIRAVLTDLPDPGSSESEGARFRLFESVGTFLERASGAQPLLICLDDLHAADEPSLLLLQFVASELERMHVLIVGAYRDLDPTPSDRLAATLVDLARSEVTYRIALGGFSEPEVRRFVELSAGAQTPEGVSTTLYADTEGNPLFVGEMVRLLAAEGRLEEQAPRVAVPESVRVVIGRRLRHLSGECRRVLTLASVIGREFGLVALERVADYTGIDKLLEVLDEAIEARVIGEVPGALGRLRFGHALIRDTLYGELPSTHRARLHRRVAEVLEVLYAAAPEPHLAELAHHYLAAVPAVDASKAADFARRAGDRALALLAYEEAARLYGTALAAADLAEPRDEKARCRLLLAVGEAQIRAGNSPAAKETFLEAAAVARRLGLAREFALAAVGYGGRTVHARAGGDVRLVPLLEDGLVALADEDVELRVRLLARLAGALRDEPSRDRRDTLSKEALALARDTESPAALAYALDGRAPAIIAPDTVTECFAIGSELCEIAARIGDSERVVHGYMDRIIAQVQLGDIPGAKVDLAAAGRIAHELRQPAQLFHVYATEAMLAMAAGTLIEAEELARRAFAFGERAQPEMAIPIYRLQQYTLGDFRGTLEDVEPAIRDLVVEYPARTVFSCALLYLQARLGRLPEAKRALDDLGEHDFSALPFDQEWLYGMSLLAETSALLGDTEWAPVLYELLLPWATFNAVDHSEGIRGSVSRYLGLLAATLERWSEAAAHFEAALEMNERMGVRPWLAHTQSDYARMLMARNGRADRERARELLDTAVATYRELGMTPWVERAAALAAVL